MTQEQCSDFGWGNVLHPDDAERTIAAWKECVRTGGKWDIEHRFRGVDGQWHPILARGVPVRNERGEMVCWAGINLDISRMKQAEESLAESRERLDLAFASSEMAPFDWDIVANKRTWGEGVHRLLGTTPETFTGTSDEFFEVIHPDDRPAVQDAIAKALTTTAYETEYRAVWPDGSIRHIAAKGRVRCDSAGRPVRLAGICWDITDRKQTETALQRVAEELQRSNTDLEQFASVASHDLQEPLRMITGFLDLLRKKLGPGLDEESQEHVSFVMEGAQRMQALIKDLLDFSRLGREGAKRTSVDLADPLKHALRDIRSSIEQSGAKVTHDPLPAVLGIPSQLARLFQNLIGNAIKFRREEPPEIHIAASRSKEGWLLSVRDNGIGIDMKSAERVFQVFQRLHTREKYEGTGIGLAICRRIVEQHNGRIWLESEVGKGTTFYFTLPAAGSLLKEAGCEG